MPQLQTPTRRFVADDQIERAGSSDAIPQARDSWRGAVSALEWPAEAASESKTAGLR
jgi:hypothetical protein